MTSTRSGLRNTVPAMAGGDAVGSRRRPGSRSSADSTAAAASSARKVHAEAGVRSVREREVLLGVGAPDVEPVRIRERRRVAVGCGDHDDHEVATLRSSASPSRVSRVAKRSMRTTDGSSRNDSSIALGISDRSSATACPLAGVGKQMCEQVGSHPLGGLDPAEQQHAGVGHDLVEGQRLACIGEYSLPGVDRPGDPGRQRVDGRFRSIGGRAPAGDRTRPRPRSRGTTRAGSSRRRRRGRGRAPSRARRAGRRAHAATRRRHPAASP